MPPEEAKTMTIETRQPRRSQFSLIIDEMHRGRVGTVIDEMLMEVGQAVEEQGTPGKVTVTLTLSRTQAGEHAIGVKLSKSIPQPKIAPVPRYWDSTKQIHTLDHPDQRTLINVSAETVSDPRA